MRLNKLQIGDVMNIILESPELEKPTDITHRVISITGTILFDRIRQTLQSAEYIDLETSKFIFKYSGGIRGGFYRNMLLKKIFIKRQKQLRRFSMMKSQKIASFNVQHLGKLNLILNHLETKISWDFLNNTIDKLAKKKFQRC